MKDKIKQLHREQCRSMRTSDASTPSMPGRKYRQSSRMGAYSSRSDTNIDLVQAKANCTRRGKTVKPTMPKTPWEDK